MPCTEVSGVIVEEEKKKKEEEEEKEVAFRKITNYMLNIGGYINGGAGDSLFYVNGRGFSTYDKDPTGNCAETYSGGFWYYWGYWSQCHYANPNGLYKYGNVGTAYTGIMWQTWKGSYYSVKTIMMKIRRMGLEDLTNL
ncbi:microfibril-associated glycoprotein 4-like [Hemibagrus wyckioides]|uniref:microfibril-associated glycoprotein 4-like n=1 Tax=Hemibagrus wyckioides TaxID=337641 RepID=UPI00266BE80D|nr:microfibril-associated glycoprotein 4-like [Hemibagrus wyckioides]